MPDRVYHPEPVGGGRATVTGDEARHLARVRRAAEGDRVELFDGRGHAWPAEVASIGKDRVELVVVGPAQPDRAPRRELTLATAVPKGERFDWLVEKATELGVARLVPLLTERSVVDPGPSKLDRLRRLIVEAAKQSGRNRLMDLDPPRPFASILVEAGPRWIGHPGGLPPGRWPSLGEDARLTLAIGPEGGFGDAEIEAATAAGWTRVGLGPTILRVETAGIVGSALALATVDAGGG